MLEVRPGNFQVLLDPAQTLLPHVLALALLPLRLPALVQDLLPQARNLSVALLYRLRAVRAQARDVLRVRLLEPGDLGGVVRVRPRELVALVKQLLPDGVQVAFGIRDPLAPRLFDLGPLVLRLVPRELRLLLRPLDLGVLASRRVGLLAPQAAHLLRVRLLDVLHGPARLLPRPLHLRAGELCLLPSPSDLLIPLCQVLGVHLAHLDDFVRVLMPQRRSRPVAICDAPTGPLALLLDVVVGVVEVPGDLHQHVPVAICLRLVALHLLRLLPQLFP
mmetsp:Transcript_80858/g.262179  ORF Transcript_80858/g.262179 Transcript_80858/m.262179 type:complete len:276 (+) Transcript_80858:1821-2648(+)